MSENVIFCFSGTGNCLDLAKNIAKGLGDTDIVLMKRELARTDVTDAKRVGFVFPCFGGGAPVDVLNYARTIRIAPDAYTFAVSSSSSYPGTGLYELNKIVPLRYWKTVKHQCSCIWLFPHDMLESVEKSQSQSEADARTIAEEVKTRTVIGKLPPNNPLNAAENKAWGKMAAKKAKSFEVSRACTGCGTCAKLCPRGNITILGNHAVIGYDCVGCLSCLQFCPEKAISMGKITEKRDHYHNPNVTAADLMETLIHID
ncbi:MAG: EFR1 family ferrodoxin [Firmicutes bacterium]|nr:EFR1 family ferrodoxin [Bacillota bacterium]